MIDVAAIGAAQGMDHRHAVTRGEIVEQRSEASGTSVTASAVLRIALAPGVHSCATEPSGVCGKFAETPPTCPLNAVRWQP